MERVFYSNLTIGNDHGQHGSICTSLPFMRIFVYMQVCVYITDHPPAVITILKFASQYFTEFFSYH